MPPDDTPKYERRAYLAAWNAAHPDYKKEWYAKHRERIKEQNAARYLAHREFALAQAKEYRATHQEEAAAWRLANAEKLKARYATYYQEHREKMLAQVKAWRRAHPEKCAAYAAAYAANYRAARGDLIRATRRQWTDANIDACRAGWRRRDAIIRGAAISDLTRRQWDTIKAAFNQKCAYCGIKPKRLTQDHVVPLSKGGNHTASNVVPACKPCNNKKYINPPPVPVQPLLLA